MRVELAPSLIERGQLPAFHPDPMDLSTAESAASVKPIANQSSGLSATRFERMLQPFCPKARGGKQGSTSTAAGSRTRRRPHVLLHMPPPDRRSWLSNSGRSL